VFSVTEVFPQVSLNFAGGASMILRPQDYLIQQNSIVSIQTLIFWGLVWIPRFPKILIFQVKVSCNWQWLKNHCHQSNFSPSPFPCLSHKILFWFYFCFNGCLVCLYENFLDNFSYFCIKLRISYGIWYYQNYLQVQRALLAFPLYLVKYYHSLCLANFLLSALSVKKMTENFFFQFSLHAIFQLKSDTLKCWGYFRVNYCPIFIYSVWSH